MKKYLEELHKLKLFHLRDVSALTGSEGAAKSLLRSYKKQQYVCQIRRDLYAVTDLASKICSATKFEIASKITSTSYISYHTAFEYHGLAHQVFFELYISSEKKFNNFYFDGITYLHCNSRISTGIFSPVTDSQVMVTDLERTVIDCIDRIDRCGGLEELVMCLSLIPYMNEEKLYQYLNQYDKQFLYQKAGFILSYYQKEMKLSDSFFKLCRENIGNSTRYLTDPADSKGYFHTWKLCAPENIMNYLEQGGNEIV